MAETADIASDANRAAAKIGGAVANSFLPGTGPLIGEAGEQISKIIDNSSGRADRELEEAHLRTMRKIEMEQEEERARSKAKRFNDLDGRPSSVPPVPGSAGTAATKDYQRGIDAAMALVRSELGEDWATYLRGLLNKQKVQGG